MKSIKKLQSIKVIAPNFKKRLSGVTATISRLIPKQTNMINISTTGFGLPKSISRIPLLQCLRIPKITISGEANYVVWHARRNTEMLGGLLLKYLFKRPLKLLFTSASQRKHTAYTQWLISKMDSVIATSEATKQYLSQPAEVVRHGIDVDEFYPIEDKLALKKSLQLPVNQRIIGCIGRIRYQKGTDAFVESMLELLPDFPDVTAFVIGRATEKHLSFLTDLKSKVNASTVSKRILFLPEVPVDYVNRYYQSLDILVAPQRWEGFGLTPLEAMSCGVPVVATRVGAFPELIQEGKTGYLIEPNSINGIVEATRKILEMDNNDYTALASNAREHIVKSFPLEKEAETIVKIYQKLLKCEIPKRSESMGT